MHMLKDQVQFRKRLFVLTKPPDDRNVMYNFTIRN